jgi:aldehyde:ferredoxin oxidoreductase
MKRRLLLVDAVAERWRLETLQVETLAKDAREDYFALSGETLCQYMLRRDPGALVIARGPLPFLSGNKASVGYVSPLTGLPHYSFVGGRAAAQLLNLGLDAICFRAKGEMDKWANEQKPQPQRVKPYAVVRGRAPGLSVAFKSSDQLPHGQRSAFYWLLEQELGGERYAGSIFTVGEGAHLGYRSANLAVDAIYHAGRGGAGHVFARFAVALVLCGEPLEADSFFPEQEPPSIFTLRSRGQSRSRGASATFARYPNAAIAPLLDKYCARLSSKSGGTIAKLLSSGGERSGKNTLPARNAQQLGYSLADLGGERILKATRHGQTGCHWCQVDCRHWHWVSADYAPDGRDTLLDDFEPTYAIFAMLGLAPSEDSLQGRLDLLAAADQQLLLPIEQMGCDVIDVGLGLSALLEGVKTGAIPAHDIPPFMAADRTQDHLKGAAQAIQMLRSGQAAEFPALRAVGDGPQALAESYPAMADMVFTSGKRTLGNAGHCKTLWTFLMPFSRFFGHYVGQYYKVDAQLPPPGSDPQTYHACFERVVRQLLGREFFWLLANALSQCAFTFVIYSQDGQGERLSDDDLLIRLLREYGVHTTRADLEWFSQAFWAQSVDLKCQFGWRPPAAADLPRRVYEALSLALERPVEELQDLMSMLIEEWKRQAGAVLFRFGYAAPW